VVDKSGNAFLNGGPDTGKKFSSPLGKVRYTNKKKKLLPPGFSINVYGEHLKSILQAVEFPENKENGSPEIFSSPEAPLLIRQDVDNMWALEPVKV